MTTPQPHVFERITARQHALSDTLTVARSLPHRSRRMIGAWCFSDHIGPAQFPADQGLHVGEHPHTRLQTFTWMIEGEMLHRDSLGSDLVIRPGQVNLMTAGHGIAHTEDSVAAGARLHGAQLWIAMPDSHAECAPAFDHYPQLPQWQAQGVQWSLLVGSYDGQNAPTKVFTPLLGLEVLHTGTQPIDITVQRRANFEYGISALEGNWQALSDAEGADTAGIPMDELTYWAPGSAQAWTLRLQPGARLLVLGGEPFAEPMKMWWNFVGPDNAYLQQAVADWQAQAPRFGPVEGGQGRRLEAPAMPTAASSGSSARTGSA